MGARGGAQRRAASAKPCQHTSNTGEAGRPQEQIGGPRASSPGHLSGWQRSASVLYAFFISACAKITSCDAVTWEGRASQRWVGSGPHLRRVLGHPQDLRTHLTRRIPHSDSTATSCWSCAGCIPHTSTDRLPPSLYGTAVARNSASQAERIRCHCAPGFTQCSAGIGKAV